MTTEKQEEKTTKTVPPPRLRFKQFEGQGEWEEKRLREVCEINPGGERIPASFIYIDLEAVSDGKLHCERVVQRNDAPSRAQRVLKSGDIIFQTVRPYQKNNLFFEAVNDEYRYVASTGYAQLRARGSEKFLYYSVLEDRFVERVIAKCTGSNYPAINSSDLSDITLFTTSLPEQQHIAATLSSLDDLITAHADKLEALRQHKRGLMQGLFPAEGERVPRLRFPEFAEAGEWKEKRLGDIAQTLGGLTGKAGKDFGSGSPFVTYKQVFDYSSVDFSKCALVKVEDGERQNALEFGDILITMSSETPEEVGYASVVLQSPQQNTYLNSFCFLLRPMKEEIDAGFSKYLFHSPPYRKAVVVLAQGVTRFNISKNRFLDLRLALPPLPEQQHIAATLSSLDDLITAQADKIAALQEFKRGLMQGLFPSTTAAAQEAGK
ncbi:restriction endonuclease subunit S [Deinococcus sp. SL84]|uniref:restriction endonuclease subunit S n=1 Tax=Deinococcus sp. SL84 TaxID=2994663 RepID=UPI002275E03B|nr:restriction endonuclease subunit S [Deinococcus sp. SL84]MCY1703696.1 restriction endonuclease subunit S [Deinococcus sp. SL84]